MTEKWLLVGRRDVHITHSERVPEDKRVTSPSVPDSMTDVGIDYDEYPKTVEEEEDFFYVRKKLHRM